MTTDDYRRALETAVREYESLGEKRRAIDQRLAELAQTIGTLSKLLGLTDAIRLVMRGVGIPMTPMDVRDRLRGIGFDVSKYANDLAAVHTILKRLNESGQLRFVPGGSGKPQYIWNLGTSVVALGPDIVSFMRDQRDERDAMQATDDDAPPPAPPRPSRRKRTAR